MSVNTVETPKPLNVQTLIAENVRLEFEKEKLLQRIEQLQKLINKELPF